MPEHSTYDLYSPLFKANPYPTYAAMRDQAPVCYQKDYMEEYKLWFVTRYADAEAVLRDHKRFVKNFHNTLTPEQRAQQPEPSQLERLLSQHMLNLDGADHTRLRNLVSKAFTTRMVQQMQDRVQTVADERMSCWIRCRRAAKWT